MTGSGTAPNPERASAWTESQVREELAPELEVIRLLGKGSMASVFLARDTVLTRLVAVKVLSPLVADDPTARVRFAREAQSAARISHPHVASVFSVGELSNDVPYIVMEYVHGRTLAEHVQATGRQDAAEVKRIFREVASALAAAHEKRVVHRDVRPANVLFEEESGKTLLTDFGLVALLATDEQWVDNLTKTGEIVGHPNYMSPEQLAGQPVTEESDVYALGMLGYELLTARPGSLGVDHPTAARLWSNRTRISELRGDVDTGLEELIYRCLADKPTHRPTATDVAHELVSAAPAESGSTAVVETVDTETVRGLFAEMRKRNVPGFVGAFVAAGAILIGTAEGLTSNGYIPRIAFPLALVFFVVGLPATAVVAWFHGERGPQRASLAEVWLLSGLMFIWIVASLMILMI